MQTEQQGTSRPRILAWYIKVCVDACECASPYRGLQALQSTNVWLHAEQHVRPQSLQSVLLRPFCGMLRLGQPGTWHLPLLAYTLFGFGAWLVGAYRRAQGGWRVKVGRWAKGGQVAKGGRWARARAEVLTAWQV